MATRKERHLWNTNPAAALREAKRRLREEVRGGRLFLDCLGALNRWPEGLAEAGLTRIDANSTKIADLTPLAGLDGLQWLSLIGTNISELTPLAGLYGLQVLFLSGTGVSNLTPLAGLAELQWLSLNDCRVGDLLPLRELLRLGEAAEVEKPPAGLSFRLTPAAGRDEAHRHLAEPEPVQCAIETLQYLNGEHPTLGGPPEPWARPTPAVGKAGAAPVSVEPYDFELQNPAGWRLVPNGPALAVVTASDLPDPEAEQLLERMRARLADLATCFDRPNTPTEQTIARDAARAREIVSAGLDAVAAQAIELWELSVGFGDHLEQDDLGRAAGRDPFDLLSPDRRGALSRLLTVSAAFVRFFPDAREMDDAVGGFRRVEYRQALVEALIRKAVEVRVLVEPSGEMMLALARIAGHEGKQAEKARSVTEAGQRNFLGIVGHYARQAIIVSGGAILAGGGAQIGADIADEFELGIRAAQYLRLSLEEVRALLPDLPADLRAAIEEAIMAVENGGGAPGLPGDGR